MAQVLIRNLDADVVQTLRERARANGRSLEAELRLLLEREARTSHSTSGRAVIAREATVPYGAGEDDDDTHYEDPNYPGIRFPKRPRTYRPFKAVKVKGKPPSQQMIEERR